MLAVDADPSLRELGERVRFQTVRDEGDEHVVHHVVRRWPFEFELVPRAGDTSRRYRVMASLLGIDGEVVAVQRVEGGFFAGQRRDVTLRFEDACGPCASRETCRQGRCEGACVVFGPSPEDTRFESCESVPDGGLLDAGGLDGGGLDADSPDGGGRDGGASDGGGEPRVHEDLLFAYDFAVAPTDTIVDCSGEGHDLAVMRTPRWEPGHTRFDAGDGPAALSSARDTDALRIVRTLRRYTLEAWLTPLEGLSDAPSTQTGPAAAFELVDTSAAPTRHLVRLRLAGPVAGDDRHRVIVTTSDSRGDSFGRWYLVADVRIFDLRRPLHVVYTHDSSGVDAREEIWIDGRRAIPRWSDAGVAEPCPAECSPDDCVDVDRRAVCDVGYRVDGSVAIRPARLSWSSNPRVRLAGATATGPTADVFTGRYHLVAAYGRVLSLEEVLRHFALGPSADPCPVGRSLR